MTLLGAKPSNLETPDTALYRVLMDVSSWVLLDATANRYLLGSQGDTFGPWRDAVNVAAVATKLPPPVLHINSADFPAIGSLNPKLRMRCSVEPNATAPGINFTFGLHAVQAPAGVADTLTLNCNDTAETGSTVAINAPAASTDTAAVSASDFALPANGRYYLACLLSGTLANNSSALLSAQLQLIYA